ncbi:hypothetical protein ACLOJK_008901 [Asimina triloba]
MSPPSSLLSAYNHPPVTVDQQIWPIHHHHQVVPARNLPEPQLFLCTVTDGCPTTDLLRPTVPPYRVNQRRCPNTYHRDLQALPSSSPLLSTSSFSSMSDEKTYHIQWCRPAASDAQILDALSLTMALISPFVGISRIKTSYIETSK